MADVTEPTALNNQAPGLLKRIAVASPFFAYLIPTYILQVILAATHHWDIRTYGVAILRPFIPAIMAFAVAWLAMGKAQALKFLKSFGNYRVHPKFYAFALLYPGVVGLISLGILRLIGLNKVIEIDVESVADLEFFRINVEVSASEELAWVSFLTTLFAQRYRLFQSSMFVGFFRGVWYIPIVLAEIQVAPGFPIVPLIANFMLIAAICAWLYDRTKSALLVFIMQLTTAYTSQIVPVLPLRGGNAQYIGFVVCKFVLAIARYVFWGPKPMFGRAPTEASK